MENKNKTLLLVEDEQRVAFALKRGLEEDGYMVEIAYDGMTGKVLSANNKYDLLIVDVNLPLLNGYELCKEIRKQNKEVPILMLTAMGASSDKLNGFESGADDYIIKPFDFAELLARIRVFLKRSGNSGEVPKNNNEIVVADLTLNLNTKTASRAGKTIELTSKEYLLLKYLMENKDKVFSRAEIAEKIWEITFDTGTNIIDVYVNYLRKKVDKDFPNKLIHTKIGLGYYLSDKESI
ncbi:MAG: response regulator transcription factor [Endomicrobiia bacterium]